jgi:sugar O-acyltransferase (sialic acid O-acetyltransferase NeuD family)
MKKLILIGGGGHCKSCIEVIESTQLYEIIGILEKDIEKETQVLGYPILGNDEQIPILVKQDVEFLITVGQIKSPNLRIKLAQVVTESGGKLATIIASTAYVSKHASIAEGTIIMHQAFVNADVKIGSNCIINTRAILEHDVNIGHNCHISVNAILNGDVKVGDNCFVGSNTVFYQGVTISENTLIGAGSIVGKSLKKAGVYLACNPLLKIK